MLDSVQSVSISINRFFDHFSQCNGLMRRGATRLTSDLESCGRPRGDSTYLLLSDNSVAAGDGGGNTFAKKLAPMLRVLVLC